MRRVSLALLAWMLVVGCRGRPAVPADDVAAHLVARVVGERVEARARALMLLAERFRSWEVMPGEALERALVETASIYPDLDGLLVTDPHGRVLAAVARAGAPPARGEPDPSAARQAAMAARGADRRGTWVMAVEGRLEMAAPVVREGGLVVAHVGAELRPDALVELLEALERQSGLSLGLEAGGRTVFPPDAPLPAEATRLELDLGHGLVLHAAR